MPTRHVVVNATDGLHARPAATLAHSVATSGVPVTLAREDGHGGPVDAASMLGIMGLGVNQGDAVVLHSDASDSAELLDRLAVLIGGAAAEGVEEA